MILLALVDKIGYDCITAPAQAPEECLQNFK
jgi:hypothetical protein